VFGCSVLHGLIFAGSKHRKGDELPRALGQSCCCSLRRGLYIELMSGDDEQGSNRDYSVAIYEYIYGALDDVIAEAGATKQQLIRHGV